MEHIEGIGDSIFCAREEMTVSVEHSHHGLDSIRVCFDIALP
jgi:hypothetical protein